MEAHDGLSAKIVEEAGFKAIWASGLAISTALGVRDSNEASWTQVLDVLEFMSDATPIPILADGDTGYGNFNNVRRLVRKLCDRNIAAVCIEDKVFPKMNSFIGEGQQLADIQEFCGRIKAGKDSQTDENFSIVARTEALIAGRGLDEALRRAEAYHAAGADAILIHSKAATGDEIFAFTREWANRCPVVIVPTRYYATPTEQFRKANISMVIWANHNLRAAITAMRDLSRRLYQEQSLAQIEGTIASLADVFALAGNAELAEAEKRYQAPPQRNRAIVLAASRGRELGVLTTDIPKCMVDIRGQPLLRRLTSTLFDAGVVEISVVRGYKKEAIQLPSISTIDNDAYESTGEAASLACARHLLDTESLICFGDILFRRYTLEHLLSHPGDIIMVADGNWRNRARTGPAVDLLACSRGYEGDYLEDEEPVMLRRIGSDIPAEEAHGEWIGLVRLSERGARWVRDELEAMQADGTLPRAAMADVFSRLHARGAELRVMYISGHWLNVNDTFDLAMARNFS